MSELWIANLLGQELLDLLPPISLIVVGFLAEKHYTGRLTLFTNAVALITFFYNKSNIPIWLVFYIHILTAVGVLSLFSYAFKIKLKKEFYQIVGIFSSFISGIILLWGLSL